MLMDGRDTIPVRRRGLSAPPELMLMVGSALGIFFTIAIGAVIASYMPAHDPWMFMASFAAPGAVAFGAYWLISRRL
jgi:hypothetical protein